MKAILWIEAVELLSTKIVERGVGVLGVIGGSYHLFGLLLVSGECTCLKINKIKCLGLD